MKKQLVLIIVVVICVVVNTSFAVKRQIVDSSSNQAEFKNEQACISVNIWSNIYTYKLTNLSKSPIIGFEVGQHASYNFEVPEGWKMDISPEIFQTWTENSKMGIAPKKTAEFSLRVSSVGAVLGLVPAKIKLQSGETITIPAVWSPVPEPKSYIILVSGLILFIVLLHSAIVIFKDRRTQKASADIT